MKKLAQRSQAGYTIHNHATLVSGGKVYFDLLHHLIAQARHTIHLQVYIFDNDETGSSVASALVQAANRGVNVFLMVDAYASQKLSSSLITGLKEAGVHFFKFEPLLKSSHFYLGRRMHHKIVTVDGIHGMVGGLNVSNRYNDIDGAPAWLDWALHVQGEAVTTLESICQRRISKHLSRQERKLLTVNRVALKNMRQTCRARIRVNDWVQRKAEITRTYLEMFRTASSHIIIMSPYFLPGHEFRKKMKQAVKRGVTIQIILAGVSDVAIAKYAERFMYRWLFRNRIQIYEYQKNILHGKLAVCDGEWMTVGSYNVNNVSAYASVELNVDVDHKPLSQHTEMRLREIITKDCVQITEESYKDQTSFLERLLQRLAYNTFRIVLFLFTFYFRQGE